MQHQACQNTNIVQVLKVKKRINTALPDDTSVQNIKDTEATCAFEATEEALTQPSIDPTIIVPVTVNTIIELTTNNIDGPLPGNDTHEEASNIDIVDSVSTIPQDLDSINPETEAHVYTYVLPTVDIFEVNLSAVDDLDDSAASASSSHYNDFERFLDDDRMMWIPRPAERVFREKKVVKKVEQHRRIADAARPTHTREGVDGTSTFESLRSRTTAQFSIPEKFLRGKSSLLISIIYLSNH